MISIVLFYWEVVGKSKKSKIFILVSWGERKKFVDGMFKVEYYGKN